MSSRVIGIVQWQTANGDSHQWICTVRGLCRILVGVALFWTLASGWQVYWNGQRERVARQQFDEEWRENQILRARHAALFERVYGLATRLGNQASGLAKNEGAALRAETVEACWAAQYALDSSERQGLPPEGSTPVRLHCSELDRGTHSLPDPSLRAAM